MSVHWGGRGPGHTSRRTKKPGAGPPPTLSAWTAALAAAKAGVAATAINCIGDSTTAGFYAGVGNTINNARARGFPGQLADALLTQGLDPGGDTFFGSSALSTGTTIASYQLYNPSISIGSGWSFPAGPYTSAGCFFFNGTTTSDLTWTTPVSDTIVAHLITASALGSVEIYIDGVLMETVSEAGSNAINKRTYSGLAATTHTLTFRRASGNIYIMGAQAYLAASNKRVLVRNLGESSGTAFNLSESDGGWRYGDSVKTLAAGLHIINVGINDWRTGVAIPTFTTQVNSIVTQAQTLGGSCLLIGPFRSQVGASGAPSYAVQQTYVDAIASVAAARQCDFLDIASLPGFATYEAADALGYTVGDGIHPSYAGFTQITNAIRARIGLWP